jgi:hypothetical protein
MLQRRIDVRAHFEAFLLEAEPQGGLLDAMQDRGAKRLVGDAEVHEAVDAFFLREQR